MLFKKAQLTLLSYALILTSTPTLAKDGDRAGAKVKKEQAISIAGRIMMDQRRRFSRVFKNEVPKQLLKQDQKKATVLSKEIEERIKLFETGKISELGLRLSLSKANIKESQRIKKETSVKIKRMPIAILDHYAKVFEINPIYSRYHAAYISAFTRTEKIKVMIEAVNDDLDAINSASLKKIKWLKPEALIKDMRKSAAALGPKSEKGLFGIDSKDTWNRILLQAGKAIAIAGFVAWGLASLKYGGRYNDKVDKLQKEYDLKKAEQQNAYDDLKNELESIRTGISNQNQAELNSLITQLENQFANLETDLTNAEMSYLQENGYTRTLCAQYESPVTRICNNYDYAVFNGTKLCTVMCYKNTTTGKETLHEPPVCSNMSLPVDCFSSTKYRDEYNRAYDSAYDPAYWDGYGNGSADGDYYGDIDGADAGYNDGNFDGYFDGYEEGDSDGYDDGYYDGYDDLWNEGYNDGYYWGYEDGLADVAAQEEDDYYTCDPTYEYCEDDYSDDSYSCDPYYEYCESLDKSQSGLAVVIPFKKKYNFKSGGKLSQKGYQDGYLDALLLKSSM